MTNLPKTGDLTIQYASPVVEKSSVTLIVGPRGSGKTTLVKTLLEGLGSQQTLVLCAHPLKREYGLNVTYMNILDHEQLPVILEKTKNFPIIVLEDGCTADSKLMQKIPICNGSTVIICASQSSSLHPQTRTFVDHVFVTGSSKQIYNQYYTSLNYTGFEAIIKVLPKYVFLHMALCTDTLTVARTQKDQPENPIIKLKQGNIVHMLNQQITALIKIREQLELTCMEITSE